MDFLLGGTAAAAAGFLTNPLEVVKTRMQLQGELISEGKYRVHYRNVFQSFLTILKHEGFWAFQRGLAPAVCLEFVMNGVRLGLYQKYESNGFLLDEENRTVLSKCIFVGGLSGIGGHVSANPLFLVKTHLQLQAARSIAVGHQHGHKGMWEALRRIAQREGTTPMVRFYWLIEDIPAPRVFKKTYPS